MTDFDPKSFDTGALERMQNPVIAQSDGYFATGSPAKLPFAVMYQGEYETLWDGTAVAVRAHARALHDAGIPVFLRSFSALVVDEYGRPQPVGLVGLPESVDHEVGHLTKNYAQTYFPMIKHAVIRDAEHLKRIVVPRGATSHELEKELEMRAHLYASTILYTVWERDRVDPAIAKILSKVAENWVPSSQNRHMLMRSGVPSDKIVVVPHPFSESDEVLKLRKRKADPSWKKFYSIGRWEPRKNYAELVKGFLCAFKPTENALLTIKYTGGRWPNYPSPEEAVEEALTYWLVRENGWTRENVSSRLHLIEGRKPRNAILKLHLQHNIYVCSSHGEAWCLPAFEAKLAGNRLVSTNYIGATDFMDPTDTFMTPSGFVAVHPSYGWESDARWPGIDAGDIRNALLAVSAPITHDPDFEPMKKFTSSAVGKLMAERVLRHLPTDHPAHETYTLGHLEK